jgi:catalase (peroxidase I)
VTSATAAIGELANPLAAVQMGLIYVNPEGRTAIPIRSRRADIRETFGRMAMNDEETVALIAGGHTFGKCARRPQARRLRGRRARPPRASRQQGFGWKNNCGKGNAEDTITSGLEGAWTANPTVDDDVPDNLFAYEWEQTARARPAPQWVPKGGGGRDTVPGRPRPEGKRHAPIMLTTDLALKETRPTARSPALPREPGGVRAPSPRPGSSSPTATWVRAPATWATRCRRRCCSGRTRCRRSTTRCRRAT